MDFWSLFNVSIFSPWFNIKYRQIYQTKLPWIVKKKKVYYIGLQHSQTWIHSPVYSSVRVAQSLFFYVVYQSSC